MSNAEKIKLIVYVNFALLLMALAYVIYAMVELERTLPSPTDTKYPANFRRVKHEIVIAAISWTLTVCITALFNMLLLKGANQRSYKKCMIWFVFCCIGATIQIYKIVISFVSQKYLEGGYLLFWTSFTLYALYVVKSFMNEIRSDSSLQPLTSKE